MTRAVYKKKKTAGLYSISQKLDFRFNMILKLFNNFYTLIFHVCLM